MSIRAVRRRWRPRGFPASCCPSIRRRAFDLHRRRRQELSFLLKYRRNRASGRRVMRITVAGIRMQCDGDYTGRSVEPEACAGYAAGRKSVGSTSSGTPSPSSRSSRSDRDVRGNRRMIAVPRFLPAGASNSPRNLAYVTRTKREMPSPWSGPRTLK